MEALKKRRAVIKGQMTKLVGFAEAINPNTKHEEIRARLDKTNVLWSEFADIESQMFKINASAESQTDEFDEVYYHAVALLTSSLRLFHVGQSNTTAQGEFSFQTGTTETKLPRLNIPSFQGDYQDWQSFFDLFNSSVHEKVSLSAAQKLQYLKSLLKGEPLGLIRHLSVTDANYIEAYQILSKRYDKKKTTINSYIETFFSQPPITRINSSTIRKMANTTEEIIRGLKAVGSQGELRDPWLIYIIINKLDDQSRQFWQHESAKIEHPTLQNLIDCLLIRADTLEGIQEIVCKQPVRTPISVRRTHTAISTNVINCPLCNTEHLLYHCSKFKEMSITERRTYIQENSRCYNCLSNTHTVQSCRSRKSCQICRKRHNSLLHFPSNSMLTTTASNIQSAHTTNISALNIPSTNLPTTETISPLNTQSINSPITETIPSLNIHPTNSQSTAHFLPFNAYKTNAPSTKNYSALNIPTTINNSSPINQLPSQNSCHQLHNYHLKIPNTNYITNTYEAALPRDPDAQVITNHSQTILPTALVYVQAASGYMHTCRVLLDSGSQASFVTEECVKRLSLPIKRTNVKIIGIGSSPAGISRGTTNLNISSRYDSNSKVTIKALVLPKVAMPLPSSSFRPTFWHHLKSVQLADPHFNETSTIDILIGADHFFDIIKDGKVYGDTQIPIAQNSIFGWIIAGNIYREQIEAAPTISLLTEIDINQSIQQFWETEEIPSTKHLSNDEELCEKHFEEFHIRATDGRFIVRLPFKPTKCELGNSVNTAIRRFYAIENRLQADPTLRDDYVNFMREYLSLEHMERIPPKEVNIDPRLSFYLPHHPVLKQSSTTTKMRVVFDASSKTSAKISLNDNLLVGPTVQDTLYAILLRFRKHRIVFTADIEKMYRQISVNQSDTEYQRIVWRENPSIPIEHYRLKTVTYGTASAPYLATKTLIKLADEFQDQYPIASTKVREDFYIDDLMTGAKNVEEAIKLKEQIIEILKSGCFMLRKWTTNYPSVLDSIPANQQELSPVEIHEESRSVKLLGLEWYPKTDSFHFKVAITPNPILTKRGMLSEASKLFDPIGWLSPSTVMVKILFQSLWLLNLNWDDPLPACITKKWMALREDLVEIKKFSIPRWLRTKDLDFQLHGFSDASEFAYAAVIYARTKNTDGTYETSIVTAKTKVTPIKHVSIPRLELCAALLLTRLLKTVLQALQCPIIKIFTWTDSANVLWWLSTHPRSWKSYVANRTSEILETTSRSNWRYVPTKENPADCASRGMLPSVLGNYELWWKGPNWLCQPTEMWPDQKNVQYSTDTSESRPCEIIKFHIGVENKFIAELAQIYATYSKLVRIIARLFQFYNNLKRSIKKEPMEYLISPMQYKIASERIFKWAQMESFAAEIKSIRKQTSFPKSSKLLPLNPFLDETGLLRVGSRIRNANIPYTMKFPIILPANHIISKLIIDETHIKYLHAPQSSMIATIRHKYWIIKCKNQVRQCIHNCIPCTRYKATKIKQLMGDLPPERVNFKYAFHQTGVDYAGPIWLKSMTGRKATPHKAYIAIFVCLSSKAVHIELVSDLSTDAFIAALKRFMSRRGMCADIFSDNGTNFVGARNVFAELQKLNKSIKHNELISNFLLDSNTKWHFIPPAAPNFGGLWEAAVKSTKYHLRRVLGNTILNFEEMSTLLTQIEAILNSRPLCLLSPNQEDALTPSHFLIGQPLTMLPEPDYKPIKQNRLTRWQLIQQLMQHFWVRWKNEYLTTLHNRSKWQHKHKNLKIDDIVLIKDENVSPSFWSLGKIIETHPGKDGIVRVVTLRTKNGVIKRPILKLVLLPVY